VGKDTDEVFAELLGMNDETINALRNRGVI
jgi:hypothetical protein